MTDELISRRAAIDIVIKGSTELGEDYSPKWVRKDLESLPTIDAVPVVRCKDCKHQIKEQLISANSNYYLVYGCDLVDGYSPVCYDGDYCSRGERKDNG